MTSLHEATLRELIASRAVQGVTAVGGSLGGFTLLIHTGERVVTLASAREPQRVFASLSTVATYLQALGITTFEVDVSAYQPARIRGADRHD